MASRPCRTRECGHVTTRSDKGPVGRAIHPSRRANAQAESSIGSVTRDSAVQYAGRIRRPFPGKETAEIHDYHDAAAGVLASSLAKRAPGYASLRFPDPRRQSR